MRKKKLLVIGDHFIPPGLMRLKIRDIESEFDVIEAATPFPIEPFRAIAEVKEASGSEEQMIDALRDVSICVAHHAPLTKRVLERAPELRLFAVCRGGPVNVNLVAATRQGVAVAYAPARNAVATAEHTIAMILSALRGIPQADHALRQGQWKGDYTWETAGFELDGATVGLVGYGAIGKIVGRILRSFGATVLVFDPNVRLTDEESLEQVTLPELLRRSNIVSLHARETPQSRGIIGSREIAQLKRGSVIVNCARGSLLDYDALTEALRSGHVSAAAADVFPEEPIPLDSPILTFDNFVVTPHLAGGTRQAAEKAATIASQEVRRFHAGEALLFCANPEVFAVKRP